MFHSLIMKVLDFQDSMDDMYIESYKKSADPEFEDPFGFSKFESWFYNLKFFKLSVLRREANRQYRSHVRELLGG